MDQNKEFKTVENGESADMKTLASLLTKVADQGYTENFAVKTEGLYAPTNDLYYRPAEVHIVNYYRFEGASNPDDMSILYLIEINNGPKGTLIDAYGTYADGKINEFITLVHDITKNKYL